MAKKILTTEKANVCLNTDAPKNTVWSVVTNAAVDVIEPKPDNEWFTQEEVTATVLSSGVAGPIAEEQVKKIISDMFILFVGNHILLQKGDKYRKFTMKDLPGGGIVIERRGRNVEDKKPIDI